MSRSPYEILGLAPGASSREVRKAYCLAALKYHPDKNPSGVTRFREATDAYKAITDGTAETHESVYESPAYPEPTYRESAYRESAYRESAYRESAYRESAYRESAYRAPYRPEPPSPPDEERPWSYEPNHYEPPMPRAPQAPWGPSQGYPAPGGYPVPASSYPVYSVEMLGQMIELLFYEEFGVRWSDLPLEAQEALLRGVR